MLITHVHSKKGKKKKHISKSWQSAPCYFPKTLPKHFDVCFCTRAHTHTSYPLKEHNLQNRPTALACKVRAGCGTLAKQGTGMLYRPKQAILPSSHCRWCWPRPRTAQAEPDRQTEVGGLRPTQGPARQSRVGRTVFRTS